jgi:two-component system, NarL family, sensor kinase
LNNVVRHAAATKVHVRFHIDGDMAVLEIEDNGKGLDVIPDTAAETAQGHYGLAGMKERAEANRGELRLLSTPGKGTTVIARVPLHKNR